MTAIGVFLFFGPVMASVAGTTLIWQGTFLGSQVDSECARLHTTRTFWQNTWRALLVLGAALAAAGTGWLGRRLWGGRLAVVIIAAQVLGDLASIWMGHFARGATRAAMAGGLLIYLLRPKVRVAFVARRAIER